MTNLFEAIQSVLKTFTDEEPKPPLHVGEVMSLWTLLAIFQEAYAYYEIALNTTTDDDLKHALIQARNGSGDDIESLKSFMTNEGLPLPPASEPKPQSDPLAIPLGAKLTDYEIANSIATKISSVIPICGTAMAQSVRSDVGILFFRYQVHLLKYGAALRTMMRERGWIIVPPYYYAPGLPNT